MPQRPCTSTLPYHRTATETSSPSSTRPDSSSRLQPEPVPCREGREAERGLGSWHGTRGAGRAAGPAGSSSARQQRRSTLGSARHREERLLPQAADTTTAQTCEVLEEPTGRGLESTITEIRLDWEHFWLLTRIKEGKRMLSARGHCIENCYLSTETNPWGTCFL